MQIKLKREAEGFRPVTIELTIESKLEWDSLIELVENPRDVANHVYPLEPDKFDNLLRILALIHKAMIHN